jgi:hypothetical protein
MPKSKSSGSKGWGKKPVKEGVMPPLTPQLKATLNARYKQGKVDDAMFAKAVNTPSQTPERLKNKRGKAMTVRLKSNMQGGLL